MSKKDRKKNRHHDNNIRKENAHQTKNAHISKT